MSHNPITVASLLQLVSIEYVGAFLAVMADLVSGIRKSRRLGHPCTSGGLRRSVSKLSSYYLSLFCLTVVDGIAIAALQLLSAQGQEVAPPFPYLTTLGSLSIALIETKSIAENSPHHADMLAAFRWLLSLLKKNFK